MKIGIIGLGKIGGTLAHLWGNAGQELILSSRNSSKHSDLVDELPGARLASPEETAREADVILLSIPLGEVPHLSAELRQALRGKIVIDTNNPYPERDGEAADEVIREGQGTGVWTSHQIPGARIVRGFNSVRYTMLQSEAHRAGEQVGIPLASDDNEAMQVVAGLVRDAGFAPMIAGELKRAKDFDKDTPPYTSGATVRELEQMLEPQKRAA